MDVLALKTDAGHRLLARYRRTQNSEDLEQSIKHFERASYLCPMDHPYRPAALSNLATAKFASCQADERNLDLDTPISLFQGVLDLHPTDHPDQSVTQLHLAIALLSRFAKQGFQMDGDAAEELLSEVLERDEPGALDEVISLYYDALRYYNTGHARRGQLLANLSGIALQTEALALHPVGHTDRSVSLNNLANLLSSRFDHRGNDEDLDETLALRPVGNDKDLDEALALHPVGHTDRSASLNNLAVLLSSRFHHRGNDEDLDEAIALDRKALALRLVGCTDRSASLSNLAARLSSHFEHQGNDEDLDEAVALHREALVLHLVGHTGWSASLNNLGIRLSFRFAPQGNEEDLDKAVTLHREVLAFNLAARLSSRFHYRGNDEDLDEAIVLDRKALALRPVGHTDRSASLNNLAVLLSSCFHYQGNDEDLDEAIALDRKALALRLVSRTDRSASLSNLAARLSSRFHYRGNDEDLDEAIALDRKALALRSVGHTDQSASLNNLAVLLSSRFHYRGNDEDLDEAIALDRKALALRPVSHTDRSASLNNLVNQLFFRFDCQGNREDLGKSLANLCSANVVSGGLLSRLQACLSWVRHASQHSHGTQLEAYATSLQLLDAYMSVTASVSSRHSVMMEFPRTLAVDAASCALHSGDVGRAVELLEQGRTIIWTQMARLRTPLDGLQTCSDHGLTLMKRFRELGSLLDKPPASHSEGTQRVDAEAEETRYRRLVKDWNGTVEDIRKIEGFSHFLLPPLFSDLQDAAHDGPIIVLIASIWSCDAIIIPHKQPPTSIQLPTNMQKLVTKAVPKDAGPKGNQRALMEALRELWNIVVRLVVENLGGIAQQGSRIWWCPTSLFNFLPLHTAGEYRRNGESLSRHYISSYTPSLTALIKARASHDRSPSITSVDATKLKALSALRDNTWFHLACHGMQRMDEPFESAFLMRDQLLSLLNIAQMDLSQHQFAFLSACETAVSTFRMPDKVIHLAAGLQFAGVKILCSAWLRAFYKNLCRDGKMNSKQAAQALHRAVQSLASDKDNKDIPLAQ
ncbi:hypothetical protein C8R48DRAFT_747702 [Suillus tomentosus]|nr:hypothetical protein C8R48DRAFT_747702 [Suillus tomentosus]